MSSSEKIMIEIDRQDAERIAWGKSDLDNFGPSSFLRAKALNEVEKVVELAVAGKSDELNDVS